VHLGQIIPAPRKKDVLQSTPLLPSATIAGAGELSYENRFGSVTALDDQAEAVRLRVEFGDPIVGPVDQQLVGPFAHGLVDRALGGRALINDERQRFFNFRDWPWR
jgi:hypothetical protein